MDSNLATERTSNARGVACSTIVGATSLVVRDGFSARQFRHGGYEGLMNPLLMVDDYTMTEPTFGAHPHAGIAAVSLLFEETQGLFYNHDSLGNHLALRAGDLYWLNAGKGAMHDEAPLPGTARIRGLQMFIKLSSLESAREATSHYVPASTMPTITAPGVRVRLAAGKSNGKSGALPSPGATLLDGYLEAGTSFTHELVQGEGAWVYAEEGEVVVCIVGVQHRLHAGQSVAIHTADKEQVSVRAVRKSHFVIVAAMPVNEPFVQKGPFALRDAEEIAQAEMAAGDGRLGSVVYEKATNL